MKTRNENKTVLAKVIDLSSGDCFTTKRTNSQENGIYRKVDKKSGAIISDRLARDPQYSLALNIETGQLRKFIYDTKVIPLLAAEVIY